MRIRSRCFSAFPSPAELRVGDRDEVVNKIDWTDSGAVYPSAVTLIMKPSVTHVDILIGAPYPRRRPWRKAPLINLR